MIPRLIEQTYNGKNVRQWRVSRREGGDAVTVRESALFPRIYTCLTCCKNACEHVDAVREIDHQPT